MIRFSLPTIEHAIRDVYSALDESTSALWKENSEDDLWRELVFCILGSRVRFETVHAAVERMDGMCLLSRPRRNIQFDQYEENLIDNMIGICYQSNFKHTTNTLDERNNMVDESIKKFGVKQTIKILKFVSNNKLCQKQASNNLKSIINNTSNTSVKFNVIPS